MKHILFIAYNLVGGGAEKALVELLRHFDYSRYEVTLCLLYNEGVYIDEIPAKVKVIVLYDRHDKFHQKSFRKYDKHNNSFWLAMQIWKKTPRWRYDAIISFLEGYPLLFHSFITLKGKKNITWVHCDLYSFHWTASYFNTKVKAEIDCYRKMDKIVFVSRLALVNFDRLYKIDVTKSCIYNVVDSAHIRSLSVSEEARHFPKKSLVITAIGSLKEVKGFDKLIRVGKLLKDDGYSFLIQIIGTGDDLDDLITLRDDLGLKENIQFLGFMKNPFGYLKHSDIFISTSLSEGLSLVICEALILGVPVVATKTAGAMDLLDNSKYGILVEHDIPSIYQGVKMLLDDSELRRQYIERAQERAKMFDVQKVLDQVYDLLE